MRRKQRINPERRAPDGEPYIVVSSPGDGFGSKGFVTGKRRPCTYPDCTYAEMEVTWPRIGEQWVCLGRVWVNGKNEYVMD